MRVHRFLLVHILLCHKCYAIVANQFTVISPEEIYRWGHFFPNSIYMRGLQCYFFFRFTTINNGSQRKDTTPKFLFFCVSFLEAGDLPFAQFGSFWTKGRRGGGETHKSLYCVGKLRSLCWKVKVSAGKGWTARKQAATQCDKLICPKIESESRL